MKSFCLILMLAIAQPVFAQQSSNTRPPEVQVEQMRAQERRELEMREWETKIFPVKHASPAQLWQALRMFRAEIAPEENLRVLSVRAPKEIMPAIADAIRMLDVPMLTKTVDLTIYLLLGSDQPVPAGKSTPSALQPVITQLKTVLPYANFQLLDTMFARGTDDKQISVQGSLLPVDDRMRVSSYRLESRLRIDMPEGKPPVVRLENMQFVIQASLANQDTNLRIGTDVEVPRGQQIVVGKATLGERAFILVMSAKFLD